MKVGKAISIKEPDRFDKALVKQGNLEGTKYEDRDSVQGPADGASTPKRTGTQERSPAAGSSGSGYVARTIRSTKT